MRLKRLLYAIAIGLVLSCTSESTDQPVSNNDALQRKLLQGWNTWCNPNLTTQVKMPEGISLSILFRSKRQWPYWMTMNYVAGPKHDNIAEKITPYAHAYDGSYTELVLEWAGLKANVITAHDGKNLVCLYTPLELPEKPPILLYEAGFLWNFNGCTKKKEDKIFISTGDAELVVGATKPEVEYNLPLKSNYLSFESDEEIGFYTGSPKTMEQIKALINEKREEYNKNLEQYGNLAGTYQAMQSVMAWNLFYDAENKRGIASVSRIWNEAWGGYVIFDWDTYFAALMASLDFKELAYSNAIAITNGITDRGFIPNVEASYGVKSNDRSQPPVGSMVCKLIYDKYQEKWFLEEVFENLLTWNRWWDKERNNQGYLSWGSDPHPRGMEGHRLQAAKFESGLDNSPLFDEAVYNPETHMLELASVGLMGLYIADCKYLSEIAEILDRVEIVSELKSRAEKYSAKLEELWDEEDGIYRDKNLSTGKFSKHLAPTNFYPLIAGLPNQVRAKRMIDENFFNPELFFGEYMIPSIARNDPAYKDNNYWRGRIWAPMNFLVYMGLRNYDLPEARKTLAEKSLRLIQQEWNKNQRVYENYNAETGVGGDVRNSDSFYSWGGLLGFIALMENGYYK